MSARRIEELAVGRGRRASKMLDLLGLGLGLGMATPGRRLGQPRAISRDVILHASTALASSLSVALTESEGGEAAMTFCHMSKISIVDKQ